MSSSPRRRRLVPAWLMLAAVPMTVSTSEGRPGDEGWRWPLAPRPAVVAGFDAPAGPYAPGHRGVDLAAGVGQPVRSAGAGVVAFAGPVAGRGVVTVAHAGGRRTSYEPVAADVAVGAGIAAGQRIGSVTAAAGHCLPGTCLHWGLRVGETYVDPLTLLGSPRVRLLPVWAPFAGSWWPPSHDVAAGPAPEDRGPLLAGLQQ